jgi:lipopolysaccharide/colanic/teichoic acid biosynthesis glycosyltransferase
MGRLLRRFRLDEVPQLWNILRGDISFVGPRPPLRQYVERFPEIYAQVLRQRPGVTGLASIHYHRHEEWLLARSQSAAETDRLYCIRCIPAKARLDLIYARHATVCLDLRLIGRTLARLLQ